MCKIVDVTRDKTRNGTVLTLTRRNMTETAKCKYKLVVLQALTQPIETAWEHLASAINWLDRVLWEVWPLGDSFQWPTIIHSHQFSPKLTFLSLKMIRQPTPTHLVGASSHFVKLNTV